MNYLFNFCGGGLGNRLLPFISGLVISFKTGRTLISWYPLDNQGHISLTQLFDLDNKQCIVIDNGLDKINSLVKVDSMNWYRPNTYSEQFKYINEFFKNQVKTVLKISNFNNIDNYDNIIKDQAKYIGVYTLGLWMSNENRSDAGAHIYDGAQLINKHNIKKQYFNIKINDLIKQKINNFVQEKNIDHNTYGIHFRLTDAKSNKYLTEIQNIKNTMQAIINNHKNAQFFICSDEPDVEKEFIQLFGQKIFSFPKTHYPTYQNNVITRNENVMIEAFIDMNILASTTMISHLSNCGCGSTFYSLAKALSNDVTYITGSLTKIFPELSTTEPLIHENGNCYHVVLKKYELVGDKIDDQGFSKLILYENDIPLQYSHTIHDDIRSIGKGRYSHWYDGLYFSTSDNSDPRTNGKTYKVVIYN